MNRNTWVDYAKAIGILLVVYGHVARGLFKAHVPFDENTFRLVDSIVYSFHMPLFFFLSGLFFYSSFIKRGGTGLIINKLDTVVYPFIVWSLLQGSIEAFLSNYTNGDVKFSDVLQLFWHPRAQFWFLYALFFTFVFCAFFYKYMKDRFLLSFLIFAGVYVGTSYYLTLQIPFNYLPKYTVFFAFGIWFNEIADYISERAGYLLLPAAVLFGAGQWLFHDYLQLTYTSLGLESLLLALVSIMLVVIVSMVLSRFAIKWLLFVGTSSMTIYLMHILAASGSRIVLQKVLHINSLPVHLLAGCVIGVVVPLIAYQIMTRLNLLFLFEPPKKVSAATLVSKSA